MKPRERPILFSGPMVRALQDGSKTQTRRVMKDQPPDGDFDVGFYHPTLIDRKGEEYPGDEVFGAYAKDGSWGIKSPFVPGMLLWVRETFDYAVEGARPVHGIKYRADGEFQYREEAKEKWPSDGKWKPSIFMPRFASRSTLKVTEVRMQKIRDIQPGDILAEGISALETCREDCPGITGLYGAFAHLWDSINGARNGGKYSWEANPVVQAVTFKRVEE